MIKSPEFDKPKYFGASVEGRPIPPIESIAVEAGQVVCLRYAGKQMTVETTKILKGQDSFEGRVVSFENMQLEHADLRHGDEVRFSYGDIEHID